MVRGRSSVQSTPAAPLKERLAGPKLRFIHLSNSAVVAAFGAAAEPESNRLQSRSHIAAADESFLNRSRSPERAAGYASAAPASKQLGFDRILNLGLAAEHRTLCSPSCRHPPGAFRRKRAAIVKPGPRRSRRSAVKYSENTAGGRSGIGQLSQF